jgi:hypothetical protein
MKCSFSFKFPFWKYPKLIQAYVVRETGDDSKQHTFMQLHRLEKKSWYRAISVVGHTTGKRPLKFDLEWLFPCLLPLTSTFLPFLFRLVPLSSSFLSTVFLSQLFQHKTAMKKQVSCSTYTTARRGPVVNTPASYLEVYISTHRPAILSSSWLPQSLQTNATVSNITEI